MAFASKSTVSARKRSVPSNARSIQTVPIQLRARSTPFWLLRLCYLQRRSFVVTFVFVLAMLTVYGWTVYSQQRWNEAYRNLENLQRDERQLTATSEVLKNHIALQAEQPATGLVPPNPATAVFLMPAPQRPARAPETVHAATKAAAQVKQPTSLPLGY